MRLLRLFILFLCLLAAAPATATASAPRVLFLSSYHPGFPTFFKQISGLHSVFNNRNVKLDVEFMDSKRFHGQSHQKHFRTLLDAKLAKLPPYDLVITSDDNALTFALAHKKTLLGNAPLVFCGVNNEPLARSMNERDDVTGVIEAISAMETIKLAQDLMEGLKTVTLITDSTPSGQADLQRILELKKHPGLPAFQVLDLSEMTFETLAARLATPPPSSCALLLSAYRDSAGATLNFEQSLDLIQRNARVPIFHLWEHGMGLGLVGGKVVTHFNQARQAGLIAMRILQGESPANIPVLGGDAANQFIIDFKQIDRFNLQASNIPENSTVLNRPKAFLENLGPLFWYLLAIILLLAAVIFLLLINAKVKRIADEKLKKNWRLYRAYIEMAPDAVLVADEGGRFVEVNTAACEMTGRSRDELLNLTVRALAAPEEEDNTILYQNTLLETGSFSGDLMFRRKDGSRFVAFVTAANITDDRYIALCRDMTENRRDERRLAMINDCLLRFGPDPNKNIALLTELFGEITGADYAIYSRRSDEGLDLATTWRAPNELVALGRLKEGHISHDVVNRQGNAPVFFEDLRATPYVLTDPDINNLGLHAYFGQAARLGGQNTGVVCAAFRSPFQPRDNDYRILGIVASAISVEEERRLAASELVAAKNRAEAANRSKDEFLANMSHEIRTPLNGIFGMLQIAREKSLDSDQAMVIETALTSTASLSTIINDILDFSKIEAGRLDLAEELFSPRKCLQTVAESFQLEVENKGLGFEVEVDDIVPELLVGDEARLRQILFNTVGNAVKFTHTGSVRVDLTRLDRAAADGRMELFLSVSDTGVGIPIDKQGLVFNAFTQVDGSYTRRYQGTGLGLSIVRRLITIMGGRISLSSEVDHGTTLYMTLPFAVPLPQEELPLPDGFDLPPGLRILLVEDDTVNRIAARRLLQRRGCEITEANNGQDALNILQKGSFDCVLMDVQMPVLDGVAATRTIRSGSLQGVPNDLPIIALTAHAMKGDREVFLEAGMNAYISKPVDMDVLVRTLARVIG